MPGEDRGPPVSQDAGQSIQPGQHLQWLDVEVGPFVSPRRDDAVDLVVRRVGIGHTAMLSHLLTPRGRQPIKDASASRTAAATVSRSRVASSTT